MEMERINLFWKIVSTLSGLHSVNDLDKLSELLRFVFFLIRYYNFSRCVFVHPF